MAEIKSFPNNQDVYVGAEWVMKWLHGRTSGVFGAENNLAVSVVPDSMSVQVSDGTGWLSNANGDGIVFWNDREQTSGNKLVLTHDAADGVLDRIDRIVATWETTNYVALPTISVLRGTASSSPVPPDLTNNSTQRQISLAKVNIPAGTISLSASMITDERLDPEVCGIVTEKIKIDTSTVQNQFEALLKSIQQELQNLNAGTAVLLKTGDTMQGTLDMGDNKITNLATPTDDNDAVSRKYVDDGLNKKLSMELLWENASPNSSFSGQTINVDLSGYDFLIIEFLTYVKTADYADYHRTVIARVGIKDNVSGFGENGSNFSFRGFASNNSGITFETARYADKYNDDEMASSNNLYVPQKIYGIKGVPA